MSAIKKIFFKGLFHENPVFKLLLGLCPTLAVTTSVKNGFGMGVSTTFVLVFSNIIISLLKNIIPNEVRIPSFIVIIATFVTIVKLIMEAYFSSLNAQLGLFIPLIVVNCIILGRAESFASKNRVFYSFLDGLGMGMGFTISLLAISSFREILGSNSVMGIKLIPFFNPPNIMVLPAGGFLTIGLLFGILNSFKKRNNK